VTARPLRIVVLSGGPSREHGVSEKSGAAVAGALSKIGHDVLSVSIGADGRWTLPGAAFIGLPGTATAAGLAREPAAAMSQLAAGEPPHAVDCVFVALHGAFGEDGTVQGFLETAGVAYTGSGVAASAMAMDKERTKEILSFHGIRTAPWVSIDREAWDADRVRALGRAEIALGFPVVVKPPRDGSSFGVSLAKNRDELERAVAEGLAGADARVLVERALSGTEVTCPVLGNRGAKLTTLPLVEIVPKGREFFDYEAKYQGASDEICPARVTDAIAARVAEAATTAHRVLGCDGVSRSDFIVDRDGQPWYLETNTVPGMTAESLCPLSARTAGISFEQLCEMLVQLAIERRSLHVQDVGVPR
jgi:D-alanine-D-alanine ligase